MKFKIENEKTGREKIQKPKRKNGGQDGANEHGHQKIGGQKIMATKLAKIAITTEADQALEAMLSKVNDGFRGGKVGKQELASWAIMQLAGPGIDGCMEAIRAAHFDDVAYLDAVVKELRSTRRAGGSLDVRAMLTPLVAAPDLPGRGSRSRKAQAIDGK